MFSYSVNFPLANHLRTVVWKDPFVAKEKFTEEESSRSPS